MWNIFKKKPAKPAPILWRVPDEHAEKFCRLYDKMNRHYPRKATDNLLFCRFAQSIIPVEHGGKTAIVAFQDGRPYVEITEPASN